MKMINGNGSLFTIVVCTYNGERFLNQCLDAILNLNGLHEFVDNVYVVDNNSTDKTKDIILDYSRQYPIIRYEFEGQQGLAYARKHAIKATTEWVIYVDDDNLLEENWLLELHKVIKENSNVGVINGAVIAKPIETLDLEQEAILKAMYKHLACTHITEPKKGDKENYVPMGAGMCIKTNAIKHIADNGWLSLVGRTEKKLLSGEDSELCQKVFRQGYTYVCCYKMKLYHLIPIERLQEGYIIRLIEGLVQGNIQYLKNQRNGYMKCFARRIKYQIILMISSKKDRKSQRDTEAFWYNKVKIYRSEAFLRNFP